MSEMAWTSHLVERLHASCGLVHKRHPDYRCDTLMARTFMHSFWCGYLLGHDMNRDNASERLRGQLHRLRKKQVSQVTGRQMFFRDMVLKSNSLSKQGRLRWTKARIMKEHGRQWNVLAEAEKNNYNHMAKQRRAERT
eukprot:425483-Amphidinium_carterae.1